MNSDINFITKKEDTSFKEKKRIKIFRIVAGCVLGITALTIVILIILYSQLKLASIKTEQESAIKNISFLHDKSAKLNSINDRIRYISEIFKTRKDFQGVIANLVKQLPDSVRTNNINLTSENLTMRLSSGSLYDIKILLDRMITLAQGKKTIADLTIDNLSFDPKNNRYNLAFSSKIL